jgi:putative tryptophan/tyrosine transport system substrate-binding protein
MSRREFITFVGLAAIAWPLGAVAQQSQKMRRIGAMINRAAGDPEATDGIAAFSQGLGELGWSSGGNVRIEYRFGVGDVDVSRKVAAELIALAPDIILASGTVAVAALQQLSPSIPVVFPVVTDPVAAGFVDNIAHPGATSPALCNPSTISAASCSNCSKSLCLRQRTRLCFGIWQILRVFPNSAQFRP